MVSLPQDVAPRFKDLSSRGEKLKKALRTASSWVLLTDQALYLGKPLERFARGEITGIEFDRAGNGPGTMLFLAGSEPLARLDFEGRDRAVLLDLEKALAPRRKAVRVFLEEDAFRAGERVRGHVEVEWPKDAPVRGIRVGLVGAESTSISVTRGTGKHRRTVTYTEEDPQIAQEWILFGGDRIGWFEAAGEALSSVFRRRDYPVLKAGRHRFPFEFKLPGDALPSHDGTHAWVNYRLYAVVDIPLGFDKVFEGRLPVVPPQDAVVIGRSFEEDRPAKGFFKQLSADLRVGFQIGRIPYRAGEPLQVRLRVENRSGKGIRSALIVLHAVESARAEGHERETTTEMERLKLKFPDPAAPTQDYRLDLPLPAWPVHYVGRYSRVDLWLSAEFDIALAFDATLTVPLEIG